VSSSSPAAKTLAGIAHASETIDYGGRQPNQAFALVVDSRLEVDAAKGGLADRDADHERLGEAAGAEVKRGG